MESCGKTWEDIELSIHSGATETLVPHSMLTSILPTHGGQQEGVEYEASNGATMNEGEQVFNAFTERPH